MKSNTSSKSDQEVRSEIGQARSKVDGLPRPEHINKRQWATMLIVLKKLADYSHYDEVFPTQKVLAAKTCLARSTVERCLDLAEAEGLIARDFRENDHRWRGTTFTLSFLDIDSQGSLHRPAASHTMTRRRSYYDSQGVTTSLRVPSVEQVTPKGVTSPPSQETVAGGRGRVNKFSGTCIRCSSQVAAGEGRTQRVDGKWKPVHLDCQQTTPSNSLALQGAAFEALRAEGMRTITGAILLAKMAEMA